MTVNILVGDVRDQLRTIAADSIHCCVTSPPYWGLRDYGVDGQIGLEASPAELIATMVEVFEEVRRVLRPDGTCWINMGDSYNGTNARSANVRDNGSMSFRSAQSGTRYPGLKPKDLCMMPHRLAIALQDAGWWVRQDIVWSKPNPMPESVTDRCTKSHEYIFLLTKSAKYFYDAEAIKEPVTDPTISRLSQDLASQEGSNRISGKTNGNMKAAGRGVGFGHGTDAAERGRGRVTARDTFKRENSKRAAVIPGQSVGTHRPDRADSVPDGLRNKRSVWSMATHSFKEAHFATFPPELPELCIKAGCPIGGTVLDPFFGAGTTGLVADRLQRDCIGIELNPAYAEIARKRIQAESPLLSDVRVAA